MITEEVESHTCLLHIISCEPMGYNTIIGTDGVQKSLLNIWIMATQTSFKVIIVSVVFSVNINHTAACLYTYDYD